ncbi:hypothetical protein CHUAL_006523 [Chamberlinius hualienensis]
MGSVVGKAMDENLKKNQEFMVEMQRVQLERQIQMQNQMRERMMAMQIAKSREFLYWFGSFYALAAIGMIAGYRKSKNRGLLVPLLPLTFIVAYQADLAYGSKLNRIKAEAENILNFEYTLLETPNGLPTPSSIDDARLNLTENERTKKVPS